jgi:hypothetical protein
VTAKSVLDASIQTHLEQKTMTQLPNLRDFMMQPVTVEYPSKLRCLKFKDLKTISKHYQ